MSDESTCAIQDELIERTNQLLEEDEWYEASDVACEALALDPAYPRAANALLRCYLHHDALREMERVLFRLFHPEDLDYDSPHQRRRRLAYSYRSLSQAQLWDGWYSSDRVPAPLSDVAGVLKEGLSALNAAYCTGEAQVFEHARAAFDQAEAACADRPALYWYLARLYADHGFFDESAEAVSHLISLSEGRGDAIRANPEVQRLWAEISWWREHGDRLPWVL